MILGEVLGKKMVSDFWMSKKTKSRRTPPGGEEGHQDRLTVTNLRVRVGLDLLSDTLWDPEC